MIRIRFGKKEDAPTSSFAVLEDRTPDEVRALEDFRTMNLEDILLALWRVGIPHVHCAKFLDKKWNVSVELHVSISGTTLDVKSEYHERPLAAARECAERTIEVLTKAPK